MHLITPSLLNSWNYYMFIRDDDAEESERKKFVATLKREKFEPSRAMQFGIDFEETVAAIPFCVVFEKLQRTCKYLSDYDPNNLSDYMRYATEVSRIVEGGTWQMPCSKQYKDFMLYGRMDVVKGNAIYDIKTTSRYDVGKFDRSAQHRLYLYCTGLEYCEYLVVEVYHGKEDTTFKAFARERYTNRNIEPVVDDFINWLDYDPELKKLYYKHWGSK